MKFLFFKKNNNNKFLKQKMAIKALCSQLTFSKKVNIKKSKVFWVFKNGQK